MFKRLLRGSVCAKYIKIKQKYINNLLIYNNMGHIRVTGTNEMTQVHMLFWQYITQNGGESNAPRNKKAETLSPCLYQTQQRVSLSTEDSEEFS